MDTYVRCRSEMHDSTSGAAMGSTRVAVFANGATPTLTGADCATTTLTTSPVSPHQTSTGTRQHKWHYCMGDHEKQASCLHSLEVGTFCRREHDACAHVTASPI